MNYPIVAFKVKYQNVIAYHWRYIVEDVWQEGSAIRTGIKINIKIMLVHGSHLTMF